ncbi:uncharacterized protein N7469_002171 [Penicillium citrinum]|uniref:Uncharacterized protein n=1 Tax=Penicillium citrinum TaxID=5077 RepID=A0A9W9TT95_PENCI|nr:uncharacterized protein N7469_002171 [Penicillium citrinum]KAJ5240580.1 hypothetical protein N7469_002171 [Penicillium citrinum]
MASTAQAHCFLSRTINIVQHRTYFDSAEFIPKSEHNSADIPEKHIETEHPRQVSISQPFCAVPGNNNVCKDANKGFQAISHEYQKCQSRLHENDEAECKKMNDG